MTVIVGTSGWQYRDWRGRFYPPRLPQRRWLEHYAASFDTVEVNNAFYRLPERDAYWAGNIADTFTAAEDVFVYFNNDPGCSAVDDAITFAEAVRQTGLWVTRVPEGRPAWGADDPVWAGS